MSDFAHDLEGRTLGEFILRERLDEGGMGAVYLCDQPLLKRSAVVKVLHRRVVQRDDASVRFVREAQLASRVDHPYAAHVYAFGVEQDDGLLWIAMELVQGISLERWLARHGPMPLDQFVPFFELVAEVVQAAHDRGIVHRDLKPANIMVIERGGRLIPKLLDFGVAKLLEDVAPPSEFADGTQPKTVRLRAPSEDISMSGVSMTDADTVVGTPRYIAPELWRGEPATMRSDLYALGVIAYESLSGRCPFRGESIEEIGRQHLRSDVPRVAPGLPSGLDRVFERALAKRPEHRFRTAEELAAALRVESDARFVSQVHVSARQWHASGRMPALLWRDELVEQLERWSRRTSRADAALTTTDVQFIEACREAAERAAEQRRRNKARNQRAAIIAVVVMALAIGGFVQYRALMVARLAQQQARDAKELADATAIASEVEQGRAALLHDELPEAQLHLGEAWKRGDRSPATAFMYARALQPLRAELARLPAVQGRMWSASWSPDGRQIVTTDDRAAQIWDAETHQLLFPLEHGDTVYDAKWTADGRRVVTACGDGAVRVWSSETGSLVRELRVQGKRPRFYVIAVSDQFVAATDIQGDSVAAWDIGTGDQLTEMSLDSSEYPSIAFSPDKHWLAAGGGDRIDILDTATWKHATAIAGPQIHAIAWDPTGLRLLTGAATGDASLWDIPSGDRVRHLRDIGEPIDAVAYSPDGHLVALAGREGSEQVLADGVLVSRSNYIHDKILSIEFDARSRLVVAAGADGSIAASEALAGLPIAVLDGPHGVVRTARFDPESRRIVGASWDGTVRIWDAGSPYERRLAAPIADGCGLVGGAVPDGRFVAVACPGHPTRVWDAIGTVHLADLPPVAIQSGDALAVFPAVIANRAAVARGNAAEVYALPGGRLIRTVVHRAAVTAVSLAQDGTLISGAADGSLIVTASGEEPHEMPPASAGIDAVASLGDRIVAADALGHIRIIEHDGMTADVAMPARARMLRPSPDGRVVIAVPRFAGTPAPPVLIDSDRHVLIAQLDGPQAFSARWADGGQRILTAHADGTARLWDADGKLRRIFHGGTRFLADADMDGLTVVGGGGDGLLRFWDRQSGLQIWSTTAYKSHLLGVHIDGRDVITRGSSGEISRWHMPDPISVIEAGKTATGATASR